MDWLVGYYAYIAASKIHASDGLAGACHIHCTLVLASQAA